jgi:predicted GNAT family acetyltransferase
MAETIHDAVAASRFEMAVGAQLAFVDYRRRGGVLILTHAEVPASLEGRGVGSRLVAGVLDLVRTRGEQVEPRCPFIARYIDRHPTYADLLAPGG